MRAAPGAAQLLRPRNPLAAVLTIGRGLCLQGTMYIGTAVLSLGIPVRLSPPHPLTPPRPAAEGCARRQGPCKLMLGILFWLHGLRAIFWIWLGVMPPLTLFAAMYMLPIPPIFGTNPTWSPVRPPQPIPACGATSCSAAL